MLKKNHIRILRELRKNSRKAFTKIGEITGMPTTTVHDNYKTLRDNIITKNVVLIDFKKIGYHFDIIFIARCFNTEDLVEYLKKNDRVNNLFVIDDKTVLFEALFKDMREKSLFVRNIDDLRINSLQQHPVYEELKRESFLPGVEEKSL